MARPILAKLGARSIEIPLDGDGLPAAFRLFKAGENTTTKGVFIFDEEAARSVMAAATEHGVDCMLDLEHLSLDQESNAYDPDARAWFQLEVRDGELWAVNVRWTEDGARRLKERTQRYISPAFSVDDEGRVTEIVNVALVAMPATHGTPALVAAANRRPRMKTLKDRKNELAARIALAQKTVRLAEGEGDAPSGKFASVRAAAEKASAALAEIDAASGDVDAAMAAVEAAVAAIKAFEEAAAGLGGAPASEPAPAPEAMADDPEKKDAEQMSIAKEVELIALRNEVARVKHEAEVQRLAAIEAERAELKAKLVGLGRETPASAELLNDLPIEKLRERVKLFEKVPGVKLGGPVPPSTSSGIQAGDSLVELSEFEVARVKSYAEKRAVELKASGQTPREVDEVVARYVGHREQQLRGAKTDAAVKRLGRRVEQQNVLLSRDGRLVTLATTPVKPIEEFGASSQRALEEFRMNYNMALAAEPKVWAETLGDMMPSGSINKDTYPINLSSTRYVKKTAQSAAAETALNFDISVTKDEFYAGEEVELRRLVGGDFAHVMSWGRRAERMARARVFLRNALVTTILEAGESGYWGQSTELATGIDGQPFFSASHKVHPRDPSKKLRGVATWSNFQSSATPLGAANLTAEKVTAFQVADPTGHEFGYEYDCLLVPSSLNEVAKNLITVQDVILQAAATENGVNNVFAGTRNPHFQSGMEIVRGPDLAGTSTTADYYLLSRAGISAGLFPWVISEDAAEDLRTWDESSDFYKDSGMIKVTSHIFCAAVLLFPHAIRKVSGT